MKMFRRFGRFIVMILAVLLRRGDGNDFHSKNQCEGDVCTYDSGADPIAEERRRCERIRDHLFRPVEQATEARNQWLRFLPVYLKTQYENFNDVQGELEFPLSTDRFNLLGPVGPRCKTKLEKYGKGDEEKRACGLRQLQSLNRVSSRSDGDGGGNLSEEDGDDRSGAESDGECVVFSIGSNNQWQFEETILNKTSCRVETFDCTMSKQIKPPKALRHRVRLHRLCLSDREYTVSDRKYVTWHQILKLTGLTTAPTFLKMDIEGYEFPVMKSVIDAGIQLPLQISMEVHLVRHENGVPQYRRRVSSVEFHSFMQYLYQFGGYYLIDRHDNPYCISCSEIVLAKLNCQNFPLINYEALLNQSDSSLRKAIKKSMKMEYYS